MYGIFIRRAFECTKWVKYMLSILSTSMVGFKVDLPIYLQISGFLIGPGQPVLILFSLLITIIWLILYGIIGDA